MTPVELDDQVATLPQKPGVYLFLNADGDILYIGKAKALRKRVQTYFRPSSPLNQRLLLLVNQIDGLDYITTDNEIEALILENNLIKKYQPKFNVRLRDDKNYPYLKITGEKWPRPVIVRSREDDDGEYFGPYTEAGAVRDTLDTLRKVFPYRSCSNHRLEQGGRPCLYHYIDRCAAPCDDRISPQDYQTMIEKMTGFLSGRDQRVMDELRAEMEQEAEKLNFERAAELRDQIRSLEKVQRSQKMVSGRQEDMDAIGMARQGDETCVQIFFIRDGQLVGREHFRMTAPPDEPDTAVTAAFLKQYYAGVRAVPKTVLVPVEPEDEDTIAAWLKEKRGNKVYIHCPQRGQKRRLVDMVTRNARFVFEEETARAERKRRRTKGAVEELQAFLDLPVAPQLIECIDISHVQGRYKVGSVVAFRGGAALKDRYRRFRVKTVKGNDDFASIKEVVERRFRRGLSEKSAIDDQELSPDDAKFFPLPDLLLIDGGKGQVNAAFEVLEALELPLPVYGLAKKKEWLYKPEVSDPVILPAESEALHLVQRVRDEAHRFAVNYHRRLRKKGSIKSVLDDIPGIGEKRKRALLKAFGSVDRIRKAGVDALAGVPAMSRPAAERVHERLSADRDDRS